MLLALPFFYHPPSPRPWLWLISSFASDQFSVLFLIPTEAVVRNCHSDMASWTHQFPSWMQVINPLLQVESQEEFFIWDKVSGDLKKLQSSHKSWGNRKPSSCGELSTPMIVLFSLYSIGFGRFNTCITVKTVVTSLFLLVFFKFAHKPCAPTQGWNCGWWYWTDVQQEVSLVTYLCQRPSLMARPADGRMISYTYRKQDYTRTVGEQFITLISVLILCSLATCNLCLWMYSMFLK